MKRIAYTIREIEPALWQLVKIQAAKRGESIRSALIRWIIKYGEGKS